MIESGKRPSPRTDAGLMYGIGLVVWCAAAIVWWASLWHASFYDRLGADLPDATGLLVAGARAGAPFVVAALLSAILAYRIRRPGVRPMRTAVVVLAVALACAAGAMGAVTLPMFPLCGELVPAQRSPASPEPAAGQHPAPGRAGPCPQ